MKKLIIILLSIAAFTCNAQTIMTDAQKDLLFADASYRQEVKWGLLNKASFWIGLNPLTSLPGGQTTANAERWRKSKLLGYTFQNNPTLAESDYYAKQFLIFVKNTAVWQGSTSATVTYMLSNGIFDTLADNAYDNAITTAQ